MSKYQQHKNVPAKPKPEKTECTLVWKDGSRCQALVPVGADEVTCGKSRFRRDRRHRELTYIEV